MEEACLNCQNNPHVFLHHPFWFWGRGRKGKNGQSEAEGRIKTIHKKIRRAVLLGIPLSLFSVTITTKTNFQVTLITFGMKSEGNTSIQCFIWIFCKAASIQYQHCHGALRSIHKRNHLSCWHHPAERVEDGQFVFRNVSMQPAVQGLWNP